MSITPFEGIPDYRVTGRCRNSLSDLLTISLLTFMCGGESYADMSMFAAERARDFGLLAGFPDHSHSADTFERVLASIKPSAIEECLREHGRRFLDSFNEKQVAIDGKKLRGVSPRSKGAEGLYLMNAFVCENQLAIAQGPVRDKENEIKALPRILEQLDLHGAVVSMDAMGTQTQIAREIVTRGAHYLLAVKNNQPALNQAVDETFRLFPALDSFSQTDADHGRIETRRCRITRACLVEDKDTLGRWANLSTLVEVTSTVETPQGTSVSVRRFISDEQETSARYYASLVRAHWGIENQLHWALDVIFKEDASRARKGLAPRNLSTVRKLALQMLRCQNNKLSLRRRRFKAALSAEYLTALLRSATL